MLKTSLPNLKLKEQSIDLQAINGLITTIGKIELPLTIGKLTRKENFHVVEAPLPFGILSINTLCNFKIAIDFNNGTIFQLGAPLSTPTYHFHHVPNECTYWECQAMSQRTHHAHQPSAHGTQCAHPLVKTQSPTCQSSHAPAQHNFFTKANCLYYMPATHKATTASNHNDNAQNVSPKRDNSHIRPTRDHTSSHNSHTHNQRNKRDTRNKRRQHRASICTATANTTTPSTRNIETIQDTQQPHNRKTLRPFLSAVNAYKKFIPDHARLRTPLVNLLKRDIMWVWDDECQKAFTSLKESLTTYPTLHFYQEGLPCQVYCNASILGIAGVLKQVYPDGKIYTVQNFSRALRAHERNYPISELQCLAIVESVDNFRVSLMDRKFTIFSDHHALQWLKEIKSPSGRLFRWRLRLSRYEYEVRSINGVQQYETDVILRKPFCGFLDASLIKSHQPSPSGKSSLTMDHNGLHTVSRKGVTKIIVPKPLITKLLVSIHTQHDHPDISKMTRLISSQYYWQNMTQDIAKQIQRILRNQLDNQSRNNKNDLDEVEEGHDEEGLCCDVPKSRKIRIPPVIVENVNDWNLLCKELNNLADLSTFKPPYQYLSILSKLRI
ncbi:hypothetical protein LAZ67_16002117 [Cordylochernes scorpioides]|uniref:RNA-directed DNA polymerase n=1 Tax=Cordylochernes scorpioides TaxID=51811 RepID=A0ABY6LD00_9ARAC|nr:hypothetical protein LAZ67_16002117 [Cordylochernes scorpioides]